MDDVFSMLSDGLGLVINVVNKLLLFIDLRFECKEEINEIGCVEEVDIFCLGVNE